MSDPVLFFLILLLRDHVYYLDQIDAVIIHYFISLIVVKQWFECLGDKEFYAFTCMLRGFLLMHLGIKSRVCQIQYLIIETLNVKEGQVDRLTNFP